MTAYLTNSTVDSAKPQMTTVTRKHLKKM